MAKKKAVAKNSDESEVNPGITKRQSDILEFIKSKATIGESPTIREICTQFGIKSPNGVVCHLNVLKVKGHIKTSANTSRSIQLSDNHSALCVGVSGSKKPLDLTQLSGASGCHAVLDNTSKVYDIVRGTKTIARITLVK